MLSENIISPLSKELKNAKITLEIDSFELKTNFRSAGGLFFHEELLGTLYYDITTEIEELKAILRIGGGVI